MPDVSRRPERINGMTTGVIERQKVARAPSASKIWLKAIELTARIETLPGRLFADVIDDWAQRQPDRVALITDDASLDYEGLSKRINRYARWARSAGVAKGDTVALIMPNGIDYVAAWLGISRIGGVAALLNTRLVGQSLAHCLDVAKPSHIIVAQELTQMLESATPHLKTQAKVWTHGDARSERAIDVALAALDDASLSPEERGEVTIDDRALLIYTSGTPPACRRLPASATAAFSIGAFGSPASPARARKTGSTIACRCSTRSAASSRPAACSLPAARW
ncbi:non-ribosomal peptide synthetase component F [Bradyrhizobium japonicum]